MNQRAAENSVIFLLGAGATVDAGMPTVAGLTAELRQSLPSLLDANQVPRPEFTQAFDAILKADPSVESNYERFFEWIKLILDVQREPYRKLIHTEISESLVDAMSHLSTVVGQEVARLLSARETHPEYICKLRDFLLPRKRLKVFTLNYDCCVEDACAAAGIDVITGFNPVTKKWDPSLFDKRRRGINLYKMHGSLRWFEAQEHASSLTHIMELLPCECNSPNSPPSGVIKVWPSPELVLGPGTKIQSDDPFLTLYYEFHNSMHAAQCCVVIGYGYRDRHINSVMDRAIDAGLTIVDVNCSAPNSTYLSCNNYHHLQLSARSALLDGRISSCLANLLSGQPM